MIARLLATLLLTLLLAASGHAQTQPADSSKIDELIRLLQDPGVQTWLESRKQDVAASPPVPAEPASLLSGWEQRVRARINGILAAVPRIPSEISAAAVRTRTDAISHGYAPVLVVFAGLILLGAAAETLYRRFFAGRQLSNSLGSTVVAEFLPIGVFTLAMAVVFFAVDWPPLARIVLLVYLAGFVVYRCVSAIIGLATEASALRHRARLFLGVLIVALAMASLGPALSITPEVTEAISYGFSIVLFFLTLEWLWRATQRSRSGKIVLSLCLAGIWLLWCMDLQGLFWIGIYALVLPDILRRVGGAVEALAAARSGAGLNDFRTVFLARGSRAVVVTIAVAWLAAVWRLDANSIVHQNAAAAAIAYGLLKSVLILLLADLVWHIARAFIDRKLAQAATEASETPAAATMARASRLRTLLPIFRNVLAVTVMVIAGLIVLAELGVEIGPLIAGAGIFGVALGFGSQTLVKDVISGVFYMLDDAFRVGEYIQSKSYKGTVESFSLRSVRLRHHRGPVFTVPFGELGAVENMSRDWVIDKFRISVGYDTDITKARKITKAIGAELLEDAEIGPMLIQTLKMKGVEEFGDYGIVLSFAMTTVPGMQTYIRRKAYAMIREAFQQNGIEFAQPTIQVGGDDKGGGAAAAATAARAKQVQEQVPEA